MSLHSYLLWFKFYKISQQDPLKKASGGFRLLLLYTEENINFRKIEGIINVIQYVGSKTATNFSVVLPQNIKITLST